MIHTTIFQWRGSQNEKLKKKHTQTVFLCIINSEMLEKCSIWNAAKIKEMPKGNNNKQLCELCEIRFSKN